MCEGICTAECPLKPEALHPRKLETHMVVSWVLGTKLRSTARAVHSLHHWAISPASNHILITYCFFPPSFGFIHSWDYALWIRILSPKGHTHRRCTWLCTLSVPQRNFIWYCPRGLFLCLSLDTASEPILAHPSSCCYSPSVAIARKQIHKVWQKSL